ncbi:hypothetical protein IG631_06100 [Alternaria alternata]|nr:hypothetical protein IG631_06100 [Alternaria alternata]
MGKLVRLEIYSEYPDAQLFALTEHAQTSSPTADAIPSSSATRTLHPSSAPMDPESRIAWTPSPSSWESGRPIYGPRS